MSWKNKMFVKSIRKICYRLLYISLIVSFIFTGYYIYAIHNINSEYALENGISEKVSLRKFPYPFKAALTIASDIDQTGTIKEYKEIDNFITTKNQTTMGKGLGLEIGNSFFFYESPKTISYFNSGPEVAKAFVNLIKEGKIDFLHSYGKKDNFSRKDAIRALRELKKQECKLDVWVDHTKSSDNFGDDVTYGLGDHQGAKEYHADITLAYGIKFVWLGRVTMINGQETPINFDSFLNIYDSDHVFCSLENILKEFIKNVLAVFGNKKYAMQEKNKLLKISTLDDGHKIYEFIRFDNYWRGVATGATSKRLAYQISEKTLDNLIDNNGYMIVYSHFGKNSDCDQYICKDTRKALRNLAKKYHNGDIYITTTSKLLNYYIKTKYLKWSFQENKNEIIINIGKIDDPIFGSYYPDLKDLNGITFYVPNGKKARVYLKNTLIKNIVNNPPDFKNKESITIKTNAI